ncbi:hypothetical protein GCM10010383_68210 [Streptomyces lomondensis]|uniref:Uncharacterized protein n=1 Tax=Streptomyces lomondensis TaxID=68229 RepID=A0ABQ2XQY6_9ACTN|nr:hypothetical protein GCM10010383_68210 [Streptomyces lomondensis]
MAAAAACAAGSLLVFAAPAEAATSKNIMLTSVPAGTGSVHLSWAPGWTWVGEPLGCFRVQAGRDTSTGRWVQDGVVTVHSFSDSTCSDHAWRTTAHRELGGNHSNWWVDVP